MFHFSALVATKLAIACAVRAAPRLTIGVTGEMNVVTGKQGVVTIDGDAMAADWQVRPRNGYSVNASGHFVPVSGGTVQMSAIAVGEALCDRDHYLPSDVESAWREHTIEWTASKEIVCERLKGTGDQWLAAVAGKERPSARVFSRLCSSASREPQLLEPLAGILRSPRVFCHDTNRHLMDVDFIVLADAHSARLGAGARRLFFDAGGSNFNDALRWFTSAYAARGITFDHIFVWEAKKRGAEAYWRGVLPEVRAEWEPRLTFYDGVPVSADPSDAANNVVERIRRECSPGDFCAWKLDIDTPTVELPLVQQLMHSPDALNRVDEFFFEHHVHGLMEHAGWGTSVNGTVADSYQIFSELRSQGVRAHSWV